MALKSARIMDFCCKSSGFADLENTVDRGSAVNFGADSGLCLSRCLILGHKRNLDHRFFFSLGRYVNEFIQIISFLEKAHLNSGVRLLLELYWVIVIKHVIFLTTCAKLLVSVVFTLTFGFYQKYWRIDGLAKKGTDRWICIPLFTPSLLYSL